MWGEELGEVGGQVGTCSSGCTRMTAIEVGRGGQSLNVQGSQLDLLMGTYRVAEGGE